jgi:hypothetical protein
MISGWTSGIHLKCDLCFVALEIRVRMFRKPYKASMKWN